MNNLSSIKKEGICRMGFLTIIGYIGQIQWIIP